MGKRERQGEGAGEKKREQWCPDGSERMEKPFLGLSCLLWHLEKIRSFRRGCRALGCQNMWDVRSGPTFPDRV